MSEHASTRHPIPAEIRAARQAAGLTQAEAAALIYAQRRTWQDWEAGIAQMHPGLWELFARKIADITPPPTLPTP